MSPASLYSTISSSERRYISLTPRPAVRSAMYLRGAAVYGRDMASGGMTDGMLLPAPQLTYPRPRGFPSGPFTAVGVLVLS